MWIPELYPTPETSMSILKHDVYTFHTDNTPLVDKNHHTMVSPIRRSWPPLLVLLVCLITVFAPFGKQRMSRHRISHTRSLTNQHHLQRAESRRRTSKDVISQDSVNEIGLMLIKRHLMEVPGQAHTTWTLPAFL